MARITASLSTRVDARGKSEILLRFVGGRDHIYRLHSDLYVAPSRFKDGAVVVPRLGTEEQRELKTTQRRLEDLANFLLDEFERADKYDVSREWMQEAVDRFHHPEKDRRGVDFFALFDEFSRSKELSKRRLDHYGVVRRSLERFQDGTGRPLTPAGFDVRTVERFRAFLEKEYPRSRNTVNNYLMILRAFFNWMNRCDVTGENPFRKYKIGTPVYGTPYFLTIDELDTIYNAYFDGRDALMVQRDIFVFQCLVGCRVGDLVQFTRDNIVDGVLVYIPRKTKDGHPVTVRVPLNDRAREIVARYEYTGRKLLPFISGQRYNDAIKDICRLAGITRPVTILDPMTRKEVRRPLNEVASSHLARRTFIGNLYKIVKDPNIIASMSGHVEGSRSFARYRDIDDGIKADLVRLLEKPDKQNR